MKTITIIDYGMGNLRSVQKAFEQVGCQAVVTADPAVADKADKLVLPGVGAFRDCMRNLEDGGFVAPIREHIASGRPFLGICVGMQLLLSDSVEFGLSRGLDIIPGHVVRFPDNMTVAGERLKVPHMGWNRLHIRRPCPLFKGIDDGSYVYFVHSYYEQPDDPAAVAATSDYGIEFCAAVWQENVMATQFHPEKSQVVGLRMLKNFGEL
jgi:imidazole glycerol-phosphate synthase subunit HisH